jgi:uncharacterized delta-60 repeat protein
VVSACIPGLTGCEPKRHFFAPWHPADAQTDAGSDAAPVCSVQAHACRICQPDGSCLDQKGDAGGSNSETIQLSTGSSFVRVRQGTEAVLTVTIARPQTFIGDVAVEVTGLPGGVATDVVVVPAGATTANLRVQAVDSAIVGGPKDIIIRAAASDGSVIENNRVLPLYVAGRAGTPDLSYGTTGLATLDAPTLSVQARDMDAQGRVVVALHSANPAQRTLIRFAQDGTLDPSFGDSGVILESEGTTSFFLDVLATPDGIYALSNNFNDPTNVRFIRRYREDGSVDPSFGIGGDGIVDLDLSRLAFWRGQLLAFHSSSQILAFDRTGAATSLPAAPEYLRELVEDASGRLIAATSIVGTGPTPVPLARFDEQTSTYVPYGGVVPGNGYTLIETDGIRPLADGNVLVAVRLDFSNFISVRLLRVTPTGSIDPTYGSNGQIVIGEQLGRLPGILIDPDGQTVVFGTDESLSTDPAHYLRRYAPNGVLDESFGTGGEITLPAGLNIKMLHEGDAGRVVFCGVFNLPDGTPTRTGVNTVGQQLRCARYWL